MRARRGEATKLFDAFMQAETDDCLLWPFAVNGGYAAVQVDGVVRLGHDVVCEKAYGPRPGRWQHTQAAHSCGVKSCLNKRHLRWASRADNEADKVKHGRSNRGERCGTSKLTSEQVKSIIRDTRLQRDIASDYGLCQQTVSDIKTGKNWNWLTKKRI